MQSDHLERKLLKNRRLCVYVCVHFLISRTCLFFHGRCTSDDESEDELRDAMFGERAHECCSCVGTHDALAAFVNNPKFSDVTFLVGSEPVRSNVLLPPAVADETCCW